MSERTNVVYELKVGNSIVYIGQTNDPARREMEHQRDKDFTSMKVVTPKLTQESANRRETELIQNYMRNHHGNPPKYNNNTTGK